MDKKWFIERVLPGIVLAVILGFAALYKDSFLQWFNTFSVIHTLGGITKQDVLEILPKSKYALKELEGDFTGSPGSPNNFRIRHGIQQGGRHILGVTFAFQNNQDNSWTPFITDLRHPLTHIFFSAVVW